MLLVFSSEKIYDWNIYVDEDTIEINSVRTPQALDPEVPGSDLNTAWHRESSSFPIEFLWKQAFGIKFQYREMNLQNWIKVVIGGWVRKVLEKCKTFFEKWLWQNYWPPPLSVTEGYKAGSKIGFWWCAKMGFNTGTNMSWYKGCLSVSILNVGYNAGSIQFKYLWNWRIWVVMDLF